MNNKKHIIYGLATLVLAFIFSIFLSNKNQPSSQQPIEITLLIDERINLGKMINNKNGREYDSDQYRSYNDYISIDKDSIYVFSLENSGGITFLYNALLGAYYDEDKNYISGLYVSRNINMGARMEYGRYRLLPPPDSKYVRLCVNDVKYPKKWSICSYGYNEYDGAKCLSETHKTIVWFGDSIVGNADNESSVTEQLSILQGALVYNMGFGSARMSSHGDTNDQQWNTCDMYKLSEYIWSDDYYTFQENIRNGWTRMPGYFLNTSRILSNELDLSGADYIIISYGTNDYKSGMFPLDCGKKEDVYTVCGALRRSIRLIQERYPKAKIIVTSPIYRFFIDDNGTVIDDSNTHDWGNGTLKDFSDAYRNVCEEMHVGFIDLYNNSKINENTRDMYFNVDDGTHPNAEGRKEIAIEVSDYIDRIEQ